MRWGTRYAILACFLFTGCLEYDSGSSGDPCTADADCPPEEVCESGRCVEEEPPSCNCLTDMDCPEGHYCTELCTCEHLGCECDCITDDDCPMDYICWDCQCIPYYQCTTTSECPSGWLCHQHGVVCDENHPCENGTCLPG